MLEQSSKMLPAEAAKRLKLSPDWIRHLVDEGKLVAERTPSGVRLIDVVDVERLERERSTKK